LTVERESMTITNQHIIEGRDCPFHKSLEECLHALGFNKPVSIKVKPKHWRRLQNGAYAKESGKQAHIKDLCDGLI
jgi:hypothetical protein